MPKPCGAHYLAMLLSLVDGVWSDPPMQPCEEPATWVTTVERGIGSYAAVCDAHDQFLRLDAGHVRSVRLPTT